MYKKAVLVNVRESSMDKVFWDKLDTLVESKTFIDRDDPRLFDEMLECDCLLVGFQTDVQKDLIDAAQNLKYIGVMATAYGTIDVEYARSKEIPVCNLAGYSTESVAEFVIAILLWSIRDIDEGVKRGREGNYDFSGLKVRELRGSKFGVVGLGDIGLRVAEIAAGFGANVSYWSRNKKDVDFAFRDLDDLLAESDYISINVAEAAETKNLLNANNVSKVKSGAVIVNTVPPSVIETSALLGRLSGGDITYITDHPDEYNEAELSELKKLPNAVLLPAIAFISDEARMAKQEMFVGNIEASLGGNLVNRVN